VTQASRRDSVMRRRRTMIKARGRRRGGPATRQPVPGLRVRLIAAQGGRGPRPRPGCPQSHSARAASSRVKLKFKNRQDLRISSPSSERSEISVPHNLLTAILVGQRFHEHAVKFLSLLTYQHFATRIQGANKIASKRFQNSNTFFPRSSRPLYH